MEWTSVGPGSNLEGGPADGGRLVALVNYRTIKLLIVSDVS